MTVTRVFKLVWRTLWILPVAIVFAIGITIGMGPKTAGKAFKVMADALNKHSGRPA